MKLSGKYVSISPQDRILNHIPQYVVVSNSRIHKKFYTKRKLTFGKSIYPSLLASSFVRILTGFALQVNRDLSNLLR